VLNHCALVVKNNTINWGPKPFRTFDVWQQTHEFKEILRKAWDNVVVRGNSLEDINDKFKRLKCEIKQWNIEVNSNNKTRKQELVTQIEELDKCDDEDSLQEEKKILCVDLLSQLRSLEDIEAAMLK